jgi:hypothetical protein
MIILRVPRVPRVLAGTFLVLLYIEGVIVDHPRHHTTPSV